MHRAVWVVVAALALAAPACSSDKAWVHAVDRSATVPATGSTAPPTTAGAPSTTPLAPDALTARELVEALAADEMAGRDNQSPGSTAAQTLIVEQLAQFAQPALPDGYLQPFAYGSNILGVIPGGELADEYVVIGAHYDHVGSNCLSADPADNICNGATDNASGVATVLSIGRAIAAEGTSRRSVLIALWDAEEDGLFGSQAYVSAPAAPLAETVAYLNFDIQGATLLPSLANVTFAIGAETGGEVLVQAAERAISDSPLQTIVLSSFLFQGRSDHGSFARVGIPTLMFSDATGGCYHTAQDEADIVDFAKLDQQVVVGTSLVRDLAASDATPEAGPATSNIAFADAVALLAFTEQSEPDLGLLSPEAGAQIAQFTSELRAIVDAGADAFDGTAISTVLDGVDQLVESLTETACRSFAA